MNYRNDSHEVLKGLVCSKLRMKILSSLDEPMRLCELKHILKSNAPNTSAKAKDLQEAGFIKRDNGDYCITKTGRFVSQKLFVLADTVESIMKHGVFWSEVIDKLPKEVLEHIHVFKDAELIRNDRKDLEKVKRSLLRLIDSAEEELTVFLPANSKEIIEVVEKRSTQIRTKLVTLREEPELRYGLISSKDFVVLFTEVMDMALVCNSIQMPSFVCP